MDMDDAIDGFAALAQETRLAAFRLLVEAGPGGLPAGDIARTLTVPHNTLSSHLAQLSRAGLVTSRRDGRQVIFAADFDGMRTLIAYLIEDCCRGRPELCAPLLDAAMPAQPAACCP
jgi:ArsR family transcriptional regulator, arsenate/arsenite/antimonite-responsive transcriptional repressor